MHYWRVSSKTEAGLPLPSHRPRLRGGDPGVGEPETCLPARSHTAETVDTVHYTLGACLALLAGVHKAVLASVPTNDDFMHRAYARQILAGDWPLRDFFDYGMGLMYVLSALAEKAFGHRLLSEAVIIGVAAAVSTYLVYHMVQRDTGSTLASVLSALILILAGPRGYSYPKLIVYAVAAWLWWRYVRAPRAGRAVALGAWTAVAYYWRPDHAAYVAAGVALATIAAHGISLVTLTRSALAGAVTIALVLPFWLFAASQVGFASFVRSGLTATVAQHRVSQAGPRWPLRRAADFLAVDPAEVYAPRIGIRWRQDSSPDARRAVIARYGLTVESAEDDRSQRVRLSERSLRTLRELIADPIVEDTAGVVRATATLPWTTWPLWDRWRFNHSWLRVHLFPAIDEHTHAGAATQVLLYLVPLMAIGLGVLPRAERYLPNRIRGAHLAWFSLFAIVVNVGLIRTPYEVRANDAVVLPAILFGICCAVLAHACSLTRGVRRWATAAGGVLFGLLMIKSIAVTGEFGSRVSWLAGDWRSPERALGAWREVHDRLWATPPFAFRPSGGAPLPVRLAKYAHACVPPKDRLLVLWFAPEIYYYSDRPMAGRHLHFTPAFRTLPDEQRRELEKVSRNAPPLAFANGALDGATRAAFPAMVEYIDRGYKRAASITEEGDEYVILVRRDRAPVRCYGDQGWPCYR